MADSETPMFTQREVRQRRRGLYWLVALFALVVLAMAAFGLTDDAFEEHGSIFGSDAETTVVEGTNVGGN